MALSTQPYKGTRDFYPEDKRLQNFIFSKWRKAAELYGYEEYDAPLVESLDLYAAKSGEEIVNEQTYQFLDRSDRKVAIRPEMTPSVSRMVAARRQELSYPLRWYSIPNLWRYERPQRGRLREHWQLNVDVFGIEGIEAEFELIQMVDNLMKSFRAKPSMYTIQINSRKLVDYFLSDYLNLDVTQCQTMAKLIDRMHKMTHAQFMADLDALLSPSQRDANLGQKMVELFAVKDINELPEALYRHPAAQEVKDLFKRLNKAGILNAQFDISVMRGFDYYTGIVFEVMDTDQENNRSILGGGRYDGLVGLFGVDPIPTVGLGMGDVAIMNFLESHKLLPLLHSSTEAYAIILTDDIDKANARIAELRQMGVKIAVDESKRKIDKRIKTAVNKGIRFAIFIGDHELAEEQYKLKDLSNGEESLYSAQRLVSVIKDIRNDSL